MTIALSANSPRVHYTATAGQTAFTIPFEFFDDGDVDVYVNDVQKTITTHYTLSGGDGSTGTATFGSGLTLNDKVTITRRIDIERTSTFSAGQTINRAALNEQLDILTAISADNKDRSERGIRVPDSENAPTLTLPSLATRKGRVLGFNASTGAMENGPQIADVQTIAEISADISALADIEDGTTSTDAISGLAAIKANVTTVAGIASNVTSVAGNATNINAVAADATDIGAVAAKATQIGLLGTADAISDMNTLGTSDAVSDMNTLAAISSDISAVGAKASIITSTLATNLTTVSPQVSTLQSLAGIFSGTQSLTVTVASGSLYGGGGTGNIFYINGSANPPLTLVRGVTYTFDVSNSSVSGHPLAFKDSGGNAFTTGVTVTGTAGSSGATVVIAVPSTGTMPASYYCTSHGAGMGNTIATQTNDIAIVANDIANVNTVASNIATISQKASVDEATALAIALGG
jgi:hypothetical protein